MTGQLPPRTAMESATFSREGEVPLDAALRSCEQEVPLAHCVRLRNGAAHSGKKRGKTGGDGKVAGHGTILLAARLSPLARPAARTIPFGLAAVTKGDGTGGCHRADDKKRDWPAKRNLRLARAGWWRHTNNCRDVEGSGSATATAGKNCYSQKKHFLFPNVVLLHRK